MAPFLSKCATEFVDVSMNASLPGTSKAQLRQTATNWFVMLLADPNPEKQRECERWRQADPAHDAAFCEVEAAWQNAEGPGQRLARQEEEQLSVYLKAMDRARQQKKTRRRLSALSIVLAALLGAAIWLERPSLLENMTADYVSERGERHSVTLPDGSKVMLDADSALSEDYTATERRVRLIRGAAFFDVTPATQPFIVSAAGAEVRVMGTGFDVRLIDDGGIVTLEHGSVSVSTPGQAQPPTVLTPAQQVTFNHDGISPIIDVDLPDTVAWRTGRFVFYRARLGDIVHEVERYRKGRVVVATTSLANERVTGSFLLGDSDAALASLQASVGFRITVVAGRLTVISR